MNKHLWGKGECYLFCVGFGLLGGILLRLAATSGTVRFGFLGGFFVRLAATTGFWDDFCSSLWKFECERELEVCDTFETKDEEGRT